MNAEQFDQLVNQIQRRYGARPWRLRLRILLLVLLGYTGFLAGFFFVLMVSASLAFAAMLPGDRGGSIALIILMALFLVMGIWPLLMFIWVPLKPIEARLLTREESPNLFRLLQMLEKAYGVRPFHSVRVTADFNACVQMIPRWGFLGGNRSHLYLGLPLMEMLSPSQFATVLAHEFGHRSSRHDWFGMWIYRLRRTWSQVYSELQAKSSAGSLFFLRRTLMRLIDWYYPRFNAYAFVLSRADEYEADRNAAEWGGGEAMGQALWRTECFSLQLGEQFWKSMILLARSEADVPRNLLTRMKTFFAEPPGFDEANRWMKQAMLTLTGTVDTHPSLADRLNALQQDISQLAQQGFPRPPETSAAETFLADALPEISSEINARWAKENVLPWQNMFHEAARLKNNLVLPDAAEDSVSATAEELWERSCTIGQLHGTEAAEPLLREALAINPAHGPAILALGSSLLGRGADEGVEVLGKILHDSEHELIPHACEHLEKYFQTQGQSEKVREIKGIANRFLETHAAAQRERLAVTAADSFAPHELSEDQLGGLRANLKKHPDCDSAWLVRKQLKHFKKQPLYILVVKTRPTGFFGGSNVTKDQLLTRRLMSEIRLPGRLLIIAPQGGFRQLAKKVMRSDIIYQASGPNGFSSASC